MGHLYGANCAYACFCRQRSRTNRFFLQPKPQNKTPHDEGVLFWWEWLDSNQLRLKPTDLQSAPALQLRRTPNHGAGRGNRTLISSLEGLHTSLCTMPATNCKHRDYIPIYNKCKCLLIVAAHTDLYLICAYQTAIKHR